MAARDDEQDVPFRWSLFLPAAGDTPSMRGLKYAVIGMGVILFLGFFVILGRIVYLTSRMDASLPAGGTATVSVPAGAKVETMAIDGNLSLPPCDNPNSQSLSKTTALWTSLACAICGASRSARCRRFSTDAESI